MSKLSIQAALKTSPLPTGESRSLLAAILGNVSTAYLIAHAGTVLNEEQILQFHQWVSRRQNGEPMAYILKQREFWSRSFVCTPGVLIPRPDTETLLEAALNVLPQTTQGWALDLGCGSGILAVSLACERPSLNILAVDCSPIAVRITQENARRHGVENRVHVIQSHWLNAIHVKQTFTLIVSNPPYISKTDPHLNEGDLRFEPAEALSADANGYADLFHLIDIAYHYLIPGGWFWLEHGYNQGNDCYARFNQAYWNPPSQQHDLAGWIRVTGAQKHE